MTVDAVSITTKRSRTHHRQPLRTLTYVTLDGANGGIVRDFNRYGLAVQAVAPLHKGQRVRVRFELRRPRLRVEGHAEVVWANSSGQSGIRFLDLPPKMIRQINEWIMGDLLESVPPYWLRNGFASGALSAASHLVAIDDRAPTGTLSVRGDPDDHSDPFDLGWLSQPLSGKKLAWTIDGLIIFAAMLVFASVFLSVSDGLPEWPMDLVVGIGCAVFVVLFYWGFFRAMAGTTLGSSLARLTQSDVEGEAEEQKLARFR